MTTMSQPRARRRAKERGDELPLVLTRRTAGQRVLTYVVAAVIALATLFPIYWALVTALREPTKVLTDQSLLPGPFSIESFVQLLTRSSFPLYFLNSVIVSLSVTAITLLLTIPVAYLLARVNSRLLAAASIVVLIAYMLPEVLQLIPVYITFVRLRLDNTLIGVILALLPITLPLGIWLMSAFFRNLPNEVEEAAYVDGAGALTCLIRVVLPNAKPGIVSVSVFSFIFAWTDYLVTMTLVRNDSMKTLPVGLQSLFGQFNLGYGQIMAGVLLICLPLLVVLLFFGKHFISSLSVSSK